MPDSNYKVAKRHLRNSSGWSMYVCFYWLDFVYALCCNEWGSNHSNSSLEAKTASLGSRSFKQSAAELMRTFDVIVWKTSNTAALMTWRNHGNIHLLYTFYDRCAEANFAIVYHGPTNISATSGKVGYQIHFVQKDTWRYGNEERQG